MDVVKLPKKVRMVCYEIMDGREEALDIRIRMPLLGRRGAIGLSARTATALCPWLPPSHGTTSS